MCRVDALGHRLVESHTSLRVLETFHPPTFYLPPEAVDQGLLELASGGSFCEWKGMARYFDVVVDAGTASERRLPGPCGSTPIQRLPSGLWRVGIPSIPL